MARLQLPIGYDDFRTIIENKLRFIDKSLLIKVFFDNLGTKVSIINRPRRFGKTFNFSMLRYFLTPEVSCLSVKGLFDNLKIAKIERNYLKHQGQYPNPTIFITFKDIKELNFTAAIAKFKKMLKICYESQSCLLSSSKIPKDAKDFFYQVSSEKINEQDLQDSQPYLSNLLFLHFDKKAFILIDGYDTPIQASYIHGYYDKMINFTQGLLGAALKTNEFLYRSVITGIIRIEKESLFLGLNNV